MNLGQRPVANLRPDLTLNAEAGKKPPTEFMADGGNHLTPMGGGPFPLLKGTMMPIEQTGRPIWARRHGHMLPRQLPGVIKGPGRGPLGYIGPSFRLAGSSIELFISTRIGRRTVFQLTKNLLTNKQYSVIRQIGIVYTYYRYVKYVFYTVKPYLPKICNKL
jgi:hypothetical protein